MPERQAPVEAYLTELAGRLPGASLGRRRLLLEIRDHLQDATSANLVRGLPRAQAEGEAVAALGQPAAVVAAWESRRRRRRQQRRLRLGLVIAAAAAATILAAAQYAEGRRPPPTARACQASPPGAGHCQLPAVAARP